MSRLVYDGKVQFHWIPKAVAIADLSAITLAELDAGTEITDFVPKDGLKIGTSNDRVDAGSIATVFKAESMGTYGAQPSLTCFLDDDPAENDAWTLFKDRLVEGTLVVLPFVGEGNVPDNGEVARVFPDLESGLPILPDPATNERQKFTVEFAMTRRAPIFDGTIVVASA